LLPAAITAALIAAYAVDVPYHDQFELIPHLDRLYSGGLRWADFDKQHNEHRILVPQTLFMLLAWLTRFDVRAELIPNFLATLLTGFLIFRIWMGTAPPVRLPWYFLLPCSALLFGWRQYESLLWGACLVNTVTVLGVTATLYFLWRSETGTGFYALALAAAFCASFSQGSGLLAWPLGLGMLALMDLPFITKVRRMTGWCFIGFLVMVAYFANYRQQVNPWPTGIRYVLSHPWEAAQYSLIYLGSPLAGTPAQARLAGLILAALLAAVLWYGVRDARFRRSALPALGILAYVLATAPLVLNARLGLGVAQAYSSRYTVTTNLAPVALLLCWAYLRSRSRVHALVFHGLAGVILVGVLLGYHQGFRAMRSDYQLKLAARASMQCFEQAPDSALAPVLYPDAKRVRQDAAILRRHRLSVFRDRIPECGSAARVP